MSPAAAAPSETLVTGDWVTQESYPHMYVGSSREGHIPGRLGNWHTASLTVETDDDWITGLVADWRCPEGADRPIPGAGGPSECTLVGGAWIDHPHAIPVTVAPRLRVATAAGTVTATDLLTDAPITVDLDITWRGKGDYVADVTRGTTVNQAGNQEQWRSTAERRDGVVARGTVGGYHLSAHRAVTTANSIYLDTHEVRAIL